MSHRIRKSDIASLISQNQEMRRLLEEWPSREIMTDFEKEWNNKRTAFLEQNEPVHIPDDTPAPEAAEPNE